MLCFEKSAHTKRASQILVLVLIASLGASCSESKVSQCSKLIDIANRAVTGVKQVSDSGVANTSQPSSIEQMNDIADVANNAKAEMEALQLNDEQLQGYQTRFITMYTDTNKATRDLVTAAEAKDAQAAQQAFNALQTATAQEEPLVTEVNTYCEVPPGAAAESPSTSPQTSP
ncbi:MAG: hypothetical protein HC827_10825 [Cyanobacteria bacterium RM1_2_2]|nr:hypothetical protein [Cyanobacteria bacterium RM1_2_2]